MDQLDCVLNVLEELGNKQLFLNHQCSGISFLPFLVLPNMLSICMDSEDFLLFSRNEPLHLLLDVLSVSDEEDESLSSTPRTRRENVSLDQYRSNSFFHWERLSVKSRKNLFFVVLLLPLIVMYNSSHPVATHSLRADLRGFLFHCCSNSSRTSLIHEKF